MSTMSLKKNLEIMQSLKEVVCILMQKSIPFLPSFLFHILTFSTKKEKKKQKKKEITTTTINILIYVLTKGRSIHSPMCQILLPVIEFPPKNRKP